MADIKRLGKISNGNNTLTMLVSSRSETVAKVTYRTKGQHCFDRFFYVTDGNTKFVLNDKNNTVIEAGPGDIVYLPSDITYRSEWEDENKGSFYLISYSTLCDGRYLPIDDIICKITNDKYGVYLKLFKDLHDMYSGKGIGYKIKCQSVFWSIFYEMITALTEKSYKRINSVIYKGILYIENNFLEKIHVNEISRMCSVSPSTFRSEFRKIKGMSPVEYVNYLRIMRAAQLLASLEVSVKETAELVSFSDVYYFSKMFKRYMGVTPGRYVDSCKNTFSDI